LLLRAAVHGKTHVSSAIMFSRFEQVIFMDCDVVSLVNPQELFDSPQFAQTGTTFFYDTAWDKKPAELRALFRAWILAFIPDLPRDATAHGPDFVNGLSGVLVEAGVVVLDKKRRFLNVLAQSVLGQPRFSALFKGRTNGDQEFFWFGAHMMREPIAFVPGIAGRIGTPHPEFPTTSHACGNHLVHISALSGRPLWFNGGLAWDKAASPALGSFTHTSPYTNSSKLARRFHHVWCQIEARAFSTRPWATEPLPASPRERAISQPLLAPEADVIQFHSDWARRVEREAGQLHIPVHLPPRNHGMEELFHAPDWKDFTYRCRVELHAMQRASHM
jgi:hypothetical protein